MSSLEAIADGVYVVRAPFSFFGLRIGARMTVLRLSDGGVLLHSPVRIDEETKRAIDALGPVRHIVAPNLFHHLHAGDALGLWPDARLAAPRALVKKRPDLHIDVELGGATPEVWKDDLTILPIEGTMLEESVILHRPTRTLVTSDLLENFPTMDHAPTRLYLKLGGVYGKPGWHRALRLIYRNRAAARRSIERILDEPFDRLVLAHGEPILERPKEAVRLGLSFVLT